MLFKAAKITDSKRDFMAEFLETVSRLTGEQLRRLSKAADNLTMQKGVLPTLGRTASHLDTLAQELRDDFAGRIVCPINDDKGRNAETDPPLNSLEDQGLNPLPSHL